MARANVIDLDPAVDAIELTGGGSLSIITFHDGTYRIEHTRDGATYSFPLSLFDIAGIRMAAGDVHLRALMGGRLPEVA